MGELRKCIWRNTKCYFHMFYVKEIDMGKRPVGKELKEVKSIEPMALIETAERTENNYKGFVLSCIAHHIRFVDWS